MARDIVTQIFILLGQCLLSLGLAFLQLKQDHLELSIFVRQTIHNLIAVLPPKRIILSDQCLYLLTEHFKHLFLLR